MVVVIMISMMIAMSARLSSTKPKIRFFRSMRGREGYTTMDMTRKISKYMDSIN